MARACFSPPTVPHNSQMYQCPGSRVSRAWRSVTAVYSTHLLPFVIMRMVS